MQNQSNGLPLGLILNPFWLCNLDGERQQMCYMLWWVYRSQDRCVPKSFLHWLDCSKLTEFSFWTEFMGGKTRFTRWQEFLAGLCRGTTYSHVERFLSEFCVMWKPKIEAWHSLTKSKKWKLWCRLEPMDCLWTWFCPPSGCATLAWGRQWILDAMVSLLSKNGCMP